jgi:squalene-hopene/tetraprenyl-beta-curcumene cyclase
MRAKAVTFLKTGQAENDSFSAQNGGLRNYAWTTYVGFMSQLFARVSRDGSWVNSADRWYEGDAALVTGYALLALSYCGPD